MKKEKRYWKLKDGNTVYIWDSKESQLWEITETDVNLLKASLEQFSRFVPTIQFISSTDKRPDNLIELDKENKS